MKKILATSLAVVLVICTSVTAFGATSNDVKATISAAVDYAFPYDGADKTDGYTAQNSKYYLMYVKAGNVDDDTVTLYYTSVKAALDAGTLSGLGNLSMVLQAMYYQGIDPEDFAGYNLLAMFLDTSLQDIDYSPYNYAYASEAAAMYSKDEFGISLCDELIATYYTFGVGPDFWGGWGASPDDVAFFILALAPYSSEYTEYIDDAVTLLETYLADEGYGYGYGDSNTDSTAMALAAYSALGDTEKADSVYELLMNFYDASTGGFTSDYDSLYATADAVFGLEYYAALLAANEPEMQGSTAGGTSQGSATSSSAGSVSEDEDEDVDEDEDEDIDESEDIGEDEEEIDESGTEEGETVEIDESATSPQTGVSITAAAAAMAMAGAGIVIIAGKKRKTA